MRRLALAGFTDDTERLVNHWLKMPGWSVRKACAVNRSRIPVAWQKTIDTFEEPADWMDGVDADVVLVSTDARGSMDELLKRLAGTGMPLVLLHPACDSLLAHELQMLYSTRPAPLWVWYPERRLVWEEQLDSEPPQPLLSDCERIQWTAYGRQASPGLALALDLDSCLSQGVAEVGGLASCLLCDRQRLGSGRLQLVAQRSGLSSRLFQRRPCLGPLQTAAPVALFRPVGERLPQRLAQCTSFAARLPDQVGCLRLGYQPPLAVRPVAQVLVD